MLPRRLLPFLLLTLAFAGAAPVHAQNPPPPLITTWSPFGDTVPVYVYMGYTGGQNWMAYQRKSDGACYFNRLSNDFYLAGSVTVNMSQANDVLFLPGEGEANTITCSNYGNSSWVFSRLQIDVTVTPLPTIIIEARAGDDYMLCGGYLYTVCRGGEGNDYIQTNNPWGSINGGSGDDVLRGIGSGEHQFLNGGEGDDCLKADGLLSYSQFSCGAGNDRYYRYNSGANGCETPVTSCFPSE